MIIPQLIIYFVFTFNISPKPHNIFHKHRVHKLKMLNMIEQGVMKPLKDPKYIYQPIQVRDGAIFCS